MKCAIARHEEGITLNGYEFVLEDDRETIKPFDNKESAINFLLQFEVSNEAIEFMRFFDYEKLLNGEYEEVEGGSST